MGKLNMFRAFIRDGEIDRGKVNQDITRLVNMDEMHGKVGV